MSKQLGGEEMIEKKFGEFICDSCGKPTPVQFVIYGPHGFQINSIDLCRECSNKFAEDIIDSLRKKNLKKKEMIQKQAKAKRNLKRKVYQMNCKSHNHKLEITNLHKELNNEATD